MKGKKGHHQAMELKHLKSVNTATCHCATSAAFWSATEKEMLRFKIEGNYRIYIFRVLQMFFKNFNAIYAMIIELYTVFESCALDMPHSFKI